MQLGLTRIGFYRGAADGVWGRTSAEALREFQRDQGLVTDGYPTIDMLGLLQASPPAVPRPS